jgi:hypothetical protein
MIRMSLPTRGAMAGWLFAATVRQNYYRRALDLLMPGK